jgi:hypothetical protein
MIDRRTLFGGTAAKMVENAIAAAEKWLDQKKIYFATRTSKHAEGL